MGDGVFSPSSTMLGGRPESDMDFDFMDELLLQGCWLETTDGAEFLQQSPSNSCGLFEPSYLWPTLEANNGNSCICPSQNNTQEERQRSIIPGNTTIDESHVTQSLSQNAIDVTGCSRLENDLIGGSEFGRRWWIGPRANPDPASSVIERLSQALGYIKDSTKEKDVLIQFWLPVNKGGKRVLTTNGQPFLFDPNCSRLASYRNISVNYQFSAEKDSGETEGLPGRVFLGKVPEWTPDVRLFRGDEFLRVNYAQWYDVRGTLALPVFERGSRVCLGVVELVTTTQKIKYRHELESICKAFEAVDLSSSEVLSAQNVKARNESYQAALPEILEVLKSACVTHRLPLAQTWVPCMQQGKGGSRHSDENYVHCVSTVDSACYVADPHIRGFHEACSEHHLLKGQGVAGSAFTTNQPCFSTDITSFSRTEYPLSHHARMFGLRAAVAIRFRSVHTGTTDFVLEFFLPVDCWDPEEQKKTLGSLSIIIQQVCQGLRVVTNKELEEESVSPVTEGIVPSDVGTSRIEMPKVEHTHSERYSREESSGTACLTQVQQSGTLFPLSQKEKPREALGAKSSKFGQHQQDSKLKGGIVDCGDYSAFGEGSFSSVVKTREKTHAKVERTITLPVLQHQQDTKLKGGIVDCGDNSAFGEGSFSSVVKTREKTRAKVERTITLPVLQHYFSGSLKNAAKGLGVCPTTLKRICRHYGIKRWPSRTIKKVGHSLEKLQRVMDSVHGASGTFQIGSFYPNFPELASPSLLGTSPFSTAKVSSHLKPLMRPEASAALKSPSSSCSQSSSSSHCSCGTQQHLSACSIAGVGENPVDGVLKRVRSGSELQASSQGPKILPRSHSHKSLIENTSFETLPALPKNSDWISREGSDRRIKVTYGQEKIRFRMQQNWGLNDLLQEISKRFNIEDTSEFHLKYLDDESEWILLTCDADLEECIDVWRSSQSHTIKLSLQVSHCHLGGSLGSSGPL